MDNRAHKETLLRSLLTLPGHVADVARHLVHIAREDGAAGCVYCGERLIATRDTSVADIVNGFYANKTGLRMPARAV